MAHYTSIITDTLFRGSVERTLVFAGASLVLQLVLGYLLALLMSHDRPGFGVMRSLLIAPVLLTPVAVDVLQEVNASLLRGTGDVSLQAPGPDGHDGLVGSWHLTWPELAEVSNRMTGRGLLPVTIGAIFPAGFTHPHLVAGGPVDPRAASLVAWPMQVASAEGAEQQRPLLWASPPLKCTTGSISLAGESFLDRRSIAKINRRDRYMEG